MRVVMMTLAVSLFAAGAHAQSAYVAGSLSADIARTGSVDGTTGAGNGEALSFSLRVGGAVTPRFGVELDFTRPSEIETDEAPDVRILADSTYVSILSGYSASALPIIGYKVHTKQRTTTVTAAAWARQEISPRLSLVYLGGVAFAKVDRSIATAFNYLPLAASIFPPTYEIRTVDYTPGPMAGVEARIGLTDHAQLVPGVRLLSVAGGWIMRPAVALGWSF